MRNFVLFAGSAVPDLASSAASLLGVRLGGCAIERFPDGETWIGIDEPVRGRDVFIVQSTAPPVNEHLVELLAFADACRRAAAASITAIVPYFGYSRQDKRHGKREPITASMTADLFEAVGIDHLVTVDLHTPQIEGFFHIPVDNLTAVPSLCEALIGHLPAGTVVVSPDAGRVKMATDYGHRLSAPIAVLHKRRESATETRVTQLVGDVRGHPCLIIDDMISTGATLGNSMDALLKAGAQPEIYIAATHGVFAEGVRQLLINDALRGVFITDTITVSTRDWRELTVISLDSLIADAVRRFVANGSLDALY